MNKKQLVFGALLGLPTLANADVTFSLSELNIAPGETKTVTVNIDLDTENCEDLDGQGNLKGTQLSTYQMNIRLPQGLYFKNYDKMTTNTEYGWMLSRYMVTEDAQHHMTEMKFIGTNLSGDDYKLTKENNPKVAFTFDVVATSNFDPEDGTPKIIEVLDVKATDMDRKTVTPKYKVDGNINFNDGVAIGHYELNSDYNYMTLRDEALSEDIELTASHTHRITVGMVNKSVKTGLLNLEQNPKGLLIRGIEGYIKLPKGMEFVNNTMYTVNERTTGEVRFFGNVQDWKDEEGNILGKKRKFTLSSTEGRIREYAAYADSLFTFLVKTNGVTGENPFIDKYAQIIIDEFVADVNDGGHHTWDFDTDNGKNILKINIYNPDSIAKENKDLDTLGLKGDLKAAIEAENDTVKNCVALKDPVNGQEAIAAAAIQAYQDEIDAQYQAGTLYLWEDPDGLRAKVVEEIAKIATVTEEQMVIARGLIATANEYIAMDVTVPTNVRKNKEIRAIKDIDNNNAGTLKNAKDALIVYDEDGVIIGGAVKNFIDAGTPSDGTLSDANFDALQQAISNDDPQGEIQKLQAAVEAANAAAEINAAKVATALETVPNEVPGNISQDDSEVPGTIAAAQAIYQAAKDKLTGNTEADPVVKSVIELAYEQGTQAGNDEHIDDVYQDAIDEYNDAVDNLNNAIEVVKDKAAANNALADKYYNQENPDYVTCQDLPDNVSQDDTQGTYAKAYEAYEAAVANLKDSVANAATAGTQAKDDIYKDLMDAVEAKIAAVADSIKVVKNKAIANNEAAANAYADELEIEGLYSPEADVNYNYRENAGYKNLWDEYQDSLKALKDTIEAAALAGTQAKDGVYDKAIAQYKSATQKLKDIVAALKNVAAANELAATNELAKEPALPEGTGKNDAYDNIKDSQAIKDLKDDFADAKTDLTTAIQDAKDNGLLGETPNPLADEIQAVEDALAALQDELDAQSAQAALNYNLADSVDNATEPQTKVPGAAEAQIVKDAKDAYDLAKQAVADQYESMVDNNVCGDADETAALEAAVADLAEATAAYEEACQTADDAITAINEKTEEVNELEDALTNRENNDSEMDKARVANPYKVTQDDGKLQIDQWEEKYNQLIENLNDEAEAIQNQINDVKAAFLADDIDKDSVIKFMNETLPELEADAMQNAQEKLVVYLIANQRGDVGGDGRLTTNDYAREQLMFMNDEFPKAEWNTIVNGNKVKTEDGITVLEDGTSTDAYMLALYDINRDGTIGIGDQQAALNNAFYGHYLGPEQARVMADAPEALTARVNGNVVAVALESARQYGMFAIDLKLADGMTLKSATTALRAEGFGVVTNELENGVTRILVTPAEPKAFEGTEGDLLYLELAGSGTVEFQQVTFADLNCAEKKFQLEAVAAGEATGISGVKTEGGVMDAIYNMGGRMMNSLKKGVNIIRKSNGETQKVIKK